MELFAKDSQEQVSEHFNVKEFACKCTRPECDFTILDLKLVEMLEKLRALAGHPVEITSGFRCAKHQATLAQAGFKTAVGKSSHEEGQAADIKIRHLAGEDIEKLARQVGFKAVGVARTWAHLDLRMDRERRWTYP